MKTIDIITNLKLYAKTENKQILADMLFAAEQEYKREETKKQGGNIALKRLKIAEKILKRNQKNSARPAFHKCFITEINGEKMQVFGNAYYFIALKEENKIPAETWNDDEQTEMKNTIAKFFTRYNYDYIPIDFDLTEVKKEYAEWKAEEKAKPLKMREDRYVLRIGNFTDRGYNAEYFVDCVECLGSDTIFLQSDNKNGIAFFKSKNGIAILCPICL